MNKEKSCNNCENRVGESHYMHDGWCEAYDEGTYLNQEDYDNRIPALARINEDPTFAQHCIHYKLCGKLHTAADEAKFLKYKAEVLNRIEELGKQELLELIKDDDMRFAMHNGFSVDTYIAGVEW